MPKYELVSIKKVVMACIIEAKDYKEAYEIGLSNIDPKTGDRLGYYNSFEGTTWSFSDAYELEQMPVSRMYRRVNRDNEKK